MGIIPDVNGRGGKLEEIDSKVGIRGRADERREDQENLGDNKIDSTGRSLGFRGFRGL
jgi:hypothetical protein